MPFKFGLRKARRYDVSSKNAYVVCVHLLDNTLIECTLTADGTGHDCMQNIAQRIDLHETFYFGFRYVNKKLQFRWLDLDRPLKKQLDKHAHSPLLYFRVMFYVADAHSITDGMARCQYYMQLKTDVVDGKLPCTQTQAVLLATYSLQAELGDHKPEKHTPELLKEYTFLPRSMSSDERINTKLIQEMLGMHKNLKGITRGLAELQYIIETLQLEGYGLEYYPAKDDSGQDLLLGASFIGIFVKYLNGQPANYFKWAEINNLTYTKRNFNIETSLSEKTVHFQLDDPDMVKYVFKMCSLQHKFYHARQHSVPSSKTVQQKTLQKQTLPGSLAGSVGQIPDIQKIVQSHDLEQNTHSQTVSDIADYTEFEENRDAANTVVPQENFYENGQVILEQQQQSLLNNNNYTVSADQQELADTSVTYQNTQPVVQTAEEDSNTAFPVRLPSYRPAPDYETIMRQRMEYMAVQQQQQEGRIEDTSLHHLPNIAQAQVYNQPQLLTYSQPEIRHAPQTYIVHSHHVSEKYPNMYATSNMYMAGRPIDRTNSLIIHPTQSTPDLYRLSQAPYRPTSENRINTSNIVYKAPPSYSRPSNSFPDLATMQASANANSSPDLVSRKNLTNATFVTQSQFDQSVENLALDSSHLRVHQQMVAKSKQELLDDTSSLQSDNFRRESLPDVMPEAVPNEEKELFITDPPYQGQPISNQLKIHQPLVQSQSTPLPAEANNYNHYGSENPYENLPSAYAHLHKPQTSSASESKDSDSIDCLDNSKISDIASITHSHNSSLDVPAESMTPAESMMTSAITKEDSLPPQVKEDHVKSQEKEECQAAASPTPSSTGSQSGHHHYIQHQKQTSSSSVHHYKQSSYDKMRVTPPRHVTPSPAASASSREQTPAPYDRDEEGNKRLSMGPLKLAALNGLSISRGSVLEISANETRAPKDERRKDLETKLEEGSVFAEYEQIPKKRETKCETSVAQRGENASRNRFKDVLPYDDVRVKLTPSKKNPTGYMNASHIKIKVTDRDYWYIAAQGPLENTMNEFWQMIWENDIEIIAMLTGIEEHGRQKCQRYWPEQRGIKHKQKYGDYEVYLKFSQESCSYTTSTVILIHCKSKKQRQLWHLQYTDWPDHGCPEDTWDFQAYLDEMESVSRQKIMERKDSWQPPVLVHCSAGVGRSGVLILVQIMRVCLEHNQNTSVASVLQHMREQRMHMVQTVSQYTFVYRCLIEYLKGSRLI